MELDVTKSEDFFRLRGQFDTALMINVLEHVPDEQAALHNLHSALERGGHAIILVPQSPALYGSLDEALDHRERYSRQRLQQSLERAGFKVETMFGFNRTSTPAWYLNGKILHRKHFSSIQIKVLEMLMPVIRKIDHLWPWSGISLIAIGVKD